MALFEKNQACKMWINFNGTGTIAIRDSMGVSSIVDNGTGDYTINFEQNMADADYAVGFSSRANRTRLNSTTAKTASSVHIVTVNSSNALADDDDISLIVFGEQA